MFLLHYGCCYSEKDKPMLKGEGEGDGSEMRGGKAATGYPRVPRGNSAKVPTSLILQFVGRRIDVCTCRIRISVYIVATSTSWATPLRGDVHHNEIPFQITSMFI